MFGYHRSDGIADFDVLIPVGNDQTSGAKLKKLKFSKRLFENLIKRKGRRVTEIPAKAVWASTWKKTENDTYGLPPELRRYHLCGHFAHARMGRQPMRPERGCPSRIFVDNGAQSYGERASFSVFSRYLASQTQQLVYRDG